MCVLPSPKYHETEFGFDALNPSSGSAGTVKQNLLPFYNKGTSHNPIRSHAILSAMLLCLILAAFLPIPAVLADGETGITLGSGAVTTGNQVYFGNYNGKYYKGPVLWRVMGTGNAGRGMLLLSDKILASIPFNPNDNPSNVWYDSNTGSSAARNWCGTFYSDSFSASEKSAVIQTLKTDRAYNGNNNSFGPSSLIDEYVFFLSAEEAESIYFSRDDDSSRIAEGADTWWWLRSPYADYSLDAGFVGDDGWVGRSRVYLHLGARPAFNLNLSSVLFSSLIPSDPESPKQYKLTLKDDALKVSLQSGKTPTMQGSTATIPYSISGQNAGNATRLLVLITNKSFDSESAGWESGAVIQKSTIKSTPGTYDTVSLDLGDLSTDKWGTDYHVYLIAEDENDGNLTNYASEPYEIQKPTPPAKPTFSPSEGSFIGAQSVTISCETADAEIRYTTDGTTPTATTGIQYSDPISISQTTTIKAIAVKNGSSSDVAETTYTITAPTYKLTVTAPTFTDVTYGAQPAAQAIEITSSGNSDAVITGVSLTGEGASAFTLNKTDGTTIAHGTTDNTTYKIQPAAGLDADTYTATITVTYNGGVTATAEVSLTVNRAENPLKVIRPLPAIVLRGGHTADLKSYINISEAAGTITYEVTYPTDHPASGCSVDDKGVFKSGNTTGGSVVKVTAAGNRNYYASNYVSDFAVVITVEVTEKPVAYLSVTQKGAISGETLQDPKYTVPEGTIDGTLTVSYSGTTTAGVSYGPSPEKPAEPGSYTVTVSCETMDTVYSGSADFKIIAATYDLTILAPFFAPVIYGYDPQPAAGAFTISNGGNSNAAITSVSLSGSGASAFTLNTTDGAAIGHGTTDSTTYTVQPKAGLDAGSYEAVFTVTYNDGEKSADLSFTVEKAENPAKITNTAEVVQGGNTVDLSGNVTDAVGSIEYAISGEANGCSLNGSVLTSGENTGSCTVTVTAAGDANHNAVTAEITVKIIEKNTAPDTTPPVAADGWTEDGKERPLLKSAGASDGGTYWYNVNNDGWTSDADSLKAKTAGTYSISYYIKGTGIYKDNGSPESPLATLTVMVADAEKMEKIEKVPLTEVPEGLKEKYSSVVQIEQDLLLKLEVNGEPAQIEQTVFLDVELMVSHDGGKTWKIATEDNFPESGLPVTLPYPEGTGKDTHFFSVSHMFTVTSERLGTTAGEVETPAVSLEDDGIHVVLRGLSPVAVAWRPKESEGMSVKVDLVFLRNDGSRGVPFDIEEGTVKAVLTIKDGDKAVSISEALAVEITASVKEAPPMEVTFSKALKDLAPGKYAVSVSGLPKTVGIFGQSGKDAPKFELSAKAEVNMKDGKVLITVYLIFAPPAPPEPVVYPLPEDEIGAYAIRADGTKEYLLFHTYDICMAWLGRADLCEGPERCYHKDGK